MEGARASNQETGDFCDLGGWFDCFPSGLATPTTSPIQGCPAGGTRTWVPTRVSLGLELHPCALDTVEVRQLAFLHCHAPRELSERGRKGDDLGRPVGQSRGGGVGSRSARTAPIPCWAMPASLTLLTAHPCGASSVTISPFV